MRPLILCLAMIAAFASTTKGDDTEISRDEAVAIKSYDLDDFMDQRDLLEGKIVKLKFTYRSREVAKHPDGSATSTLFLYRYRNNIGAESESGYQAVRIPKDGMDWFYKLPTTSSRKSHVVFAKVTKNAEGTLIAELLGRDMKTALKGSAISW
jgi:hypothetical protein